MPRPNRRRCSLGVSTTDRRCHGHGPVSPSQGGLRQAPEAVRRYVMAVADRVSRVFGPDVVGTYTTGSLALGDFRAGRSDVDLMTVIDGDDHRDDCLDLAAILDHSRLPCPAAGLELVVYARSTVTTPTTDAGYLLNLNTGAELPPVVSVDPASTSAFWFAIDRAITWQSGEAVRGPAPRHLFRPPDRHALLPIVVSAVEAQRPNGGDLLDSMVLNACRALLYAENWHWYSKVEAGRRVAVASEQFAPLIHAAIATHERGRRAAKELPAEDVRTFLDHMSEALRRASVKEGR